MHDQLVPLALRPPGTVVDNQFRLRRVIGAGGMGSVHEVEDLTTGQIGALKVIHSRHLNSQEAVLRFLREASASGCINSPHTVKIERAGRLKDERPYLLMELLEGISLTSWLRQRGQLSQPQAVHICLQAADGLISAHGAGIVHRDIKPDNLHIRGAELPFVKILDFGISKFLSNDLTKLTKLGRSLGTFSYMPPEQMTGATDIDERADIYSLGVVLYECLIGHPPFVARSLSMLSRMMIQENYQPISHLRPELAPELDRVLSQCLAHDRSARFAKMSDFRTALAPLAHSEKLVAMPMVSVGEARQSASTGASSQEPARRPLSSDQIDQDTVFPLSAPGFRL